MPGTPPSSRAQAFRDQARLDEWGIGGQGFDITLCNTNVQPADGRIYTVLVGLNRGDVVTNLVAFVTAGGVGTVPTVIRLGVADAAGTMLARTAAVQASAEWTAGDSPAPIALTTPLVVPETAGYQLCFIQAGTWGTTNVTLLAPELRGSTLQHTGPLMVGNSGTGQSDLPAVAAALPALSGPGAIPWLGWS